MNTKRKKILYVITKSNFGGAQRYVYELATNLPPEDFEVTVAFGGAGLLKQKLEAAGIHTRSIPSFERDINLRKEFTSLFELFRLIREIQPDIVHLNSSKAGGSGALIARLSGVPKIIFTAHGWPFHEKRNIVWRIAVWTLSSVTAVLSHTTILVSQYDKDNSWMPFVGKKLHVIHTALPRIDFLTSDMARRVLFLPEIIATHREDIWLVSNAELTQNKNILTAIKSVQTYNKNNPPRRIFYTVLGSGELLSELRAYIQLHGLEDTIYLGGYIPEARIYLKAFDMFILPSFKEGLPYALLEAGAAEIPAIASNVGGIPEIIDDEDTGILINPDDENSIVEALERLVSNESVRTQYAQKLQNTVDTQFNIKNMLQETLALYTTQN